MDRKIEIIFSKTTILNRAKAFGMIGLRLCMIMAISHRAQNRLSTSS
jgi:hypothetical protein